MKMKNTELHRKFKNLFVTFFILFSFPIESLNFLFMIKKFLITGFILISTVLVFGQKGDSKNLYGVSFGLSVAKESGFYIDFGETSSWPDKKTSPVFQLFYARQVSESFRIGGFFEYESTKMDI